MRHETLDEKEGHEMRDDRRVSCHMSLVLSCLPSNVSRPDVIPKQSLM